MLASGRANHQPINMKDIIPTLSQPTNSWNILLAVTSVNIASRNTRRYLKNRVICGSCDMYQLANSRMDHVTKRLIGINVREYMSKTRLILISMLAMLVHAKLVVEASMP